MAKHDWKKGEWNYVVLDLHYRRIDLCNRCGHYRVALKLLEAGPVDNVVYFPPDWDEDLEHALLMTSTPPCIERVKYDIP